LLLFFFSFSFSFFFFVGYLNWKCKSLIGGCFWCIEALKGGWDCAWGREADWGWFSFSWEVEFEVIGDVNVLQGW